MTTKRYALESLEMERDAIIARLQEIDEVLTALDAALRPPHHVAGAALTIAIALTSGLGPRPTLN